jgi:hypothetical protein
MLFTLATLFVFSDVAISGTFFANPLEGRWDLTVDMVYKTAPSWLEVRHSGNSGLVGYFVADGGSARPVSKVSVDGNTFSFTIPPQWEQGAGNLELKGVRDGDKVSGKITQPDGKVFSFTGERAPTLERKSPVSWGAPIELFNGKNTNGWHTSGEKQQWTGVGGTLKSPESGSNLITDQKFTDFKLHIEFRYPAHSNSGVYLRGRYEVQVEDSKSTEPKSEEIGGIYGFITPNELFTKGPGQWQVYDITLIGRTVTVVANGKTIICNQLIPGITGGALDSKEGEPGPIMLQGDHGPIAYRNIVITPAK